MKNNDFYVLSQLSDKLKKHEFICEIKSKYGRPYLDFDTWEVPYQTVLGMLISVEGNSLKLEFVNFRAVKGVTNDFEDDDCSNRVQATAYCDAFEMVASRTAGLNNLKFLVDSNGLPTIDAGSEIFIPRKITGKFYDYVVDALLDVLDKLDSVMPEIIDLGGRIYDERKNPPVRKRKLGTTTYI